MTTDDRHGPRGAGDPRGSGDDERPLDEARELREVAARLRAVLDDEAGTVTPSNRLSAVLAAAHEVPAAAARQRRRWAPAAAAAAALVVVAGGVALASRPGAPPVSADGTVTATPAAPLTLPSTPAGPSTTTGLPTSIPTRTAPPAVVPTTASHTTSTSTRVVQVPAPPATTASAPSTTTSTSPPPSPTTPAAPTTDTPPSTSPDLPVYVAGPVVDGSSRLVLFRTWAPTDLPRGDVARRVQAALGLALGAPAKGTPWVSLSPGTTVESATVADSGITVTLAAPLDGGSDAATALAVQQLVFTAQAAAGKPSPVTLDVADGSTDVAPGVAAGSTLQRPDATTAATLLSAVWVDQPSGGETVSAGKPLEVTGTASTYEATVVWQVLRGTTVVEKGSATADAAAPRRGSFTFTTAAPLPAGSYTVRVLAESAADGSVVAEQRVPVVVR
ncbi:immunoglobulin-like protein involved in spore germination [Terracoccus luteus]|uniref:Immunoglobulin-like protein involved in spore germination n=1 Tax=Terracoccus luteus TaxID=53356 RepID=A0A495XY83_9MICO|nr:Gmad2 immunoglobulin-like domain-containing protein [Terracoccus luteus]RKT77666.1 immunoglobulin-like protein involved in spore germination [Terracoccus luteus]